ncbi:T9SS type A sorting domain-containing protein [Psychroserpens jangbogonensis]|uniref:HYR-like domain-containing protein n=1 Tax=Psychroserpens jangbogonensis TaxID=1484460 RepID=UPI001269C376|nr:T9SS type A sorting domain-containing protein [Psychroserpens jangbogonensis]
MSNFTRSGSRAKIWQSITNLSCCSIDLITKQTRSMKAFAFIMLFAFSVGTVEAQEERSTFFDRCQEDAPPGPSEADVANLYLNQCGDTPATVTKTAIMSGDDCDWEVEYTYFIKCGAFEEEIKVGYVGGDRTPPSLNDGAQVPTGELGMNLCFSQAPAGPKVTSIAALYSDNCGEVLVTKSGSPQGDDCSWTAFYKYSIMDSCGNMIADLDVNYTGGDTEAPQLLKDAEVPVGSNTLNLCFDNKPLGPTELEIAALFSDNCGTVLVTKSLGTEKGNDDCKWLSAFEYTIQDSCGNFADPIYVEYMGGDTEDPVLSGVPIDTEVTCIDLIPAPANVTATDNCTDNIQAVLTENYDNLGLACEGGELVRTWTATDLCGNSISASQTIVVLPAPMASFEPVSPETISCEEAFSFQADDLIYNNGVSKSACAIVGSVPGLVTSNFTLCGGTITVNWTYTDDCLRTINAEKVYTVTPAPAATLDVVENFTLSCEAAAAYVAPSLNYSNGLQGDCSLDGSIPPVQKDQFDACGGKIIVEYIGEDACGNPLSTILDITVSPAPAAVFDAIEVESELSCADADTYTATALNYSNGLEGICNISGSIEPVQTNEFDSCGGKITITWTGQDECENPLTATVDINVLPAPEADVTTPEFPSNVSCADAAGFTAADATYTNGLEGTCNISGSLEATVVKLYDSCGGKITITYNGEDACGRPLSAGPFDVDVDPAPEATVSAPEFPSDIMCSDAAGFSAANATYSNGLTGDCEISGSLEANIVRAYDLCGGKITITYNGEDACGRLLSAGPFDVNVNPAPEASFDTAAHEEISCEQADGYSAPSLNYSNGLEGECGINGTVDGVLSGEFTSCGGLLYVDWTYTDECGRLITARKQLKVSPAPAPTLDEVENFTLSCSDADGYQALPLYYSNGLEGTCNISGDLLPVQTNNFNECGGTITVTWDGTDICGTPLSATQTITVSPAPEAMFINPLPSIEVACDLADDYIVTNLAYSNGLEGTCGINGDVPGALSGSYDACGGTLYVDWKFVDNCGREIDYRKTITVLPAPEAEVTAPEFSDKIACADAAGFAADDATYTNGLTGLCEISGSIEATVVKNYTACGGTITITYDGVDACQNPLSAGPFVIDVDPAPEATVTAPEFPANIMCADAAGFAAGNATYSNGLEGTACDISGDIEATVVKNYTACGGTITITYTGKDLCERDLAAGPYVINVDPAPEATVTTPEFPANIMCADAAGFAAGNATYSNGLEGTACDISGEIEATVVKNYTACGGTITISYAGKDICDRDLAAGPFVIEVDPAPEATVTTPEFSDKIACSDAAGFAADDATYSNGLEETACEISGSIEATVVKNYTACGGTITISYAGKDICDRDLAAGPFVIEVDPAPEAEVTTPEFPTNIMCADAAGFAAGNATYSNGLEQTACDISGEIEATVVKNYTACGGTITITYAGKDICERDLAAGPFVINVDPAPEAEVTTPEFSDKIACADAAGFAAGNATYSNGLEGTACEISGSIEATVVKNYTACGGTITITYAGKDICDRDLAAGPFVIEVDPAPEAEVTTPEFPTNIMCADAAGFAAGNATYSNGLEGTACDISGEIEATVVKNYTACGGTITITYVGKDICERDLAAGPFVITVDPAPEATVTAPEFPANIMCADAAGFAAGNATYSNGLEGTACDISGDIEATVVKNYTACGGTITITYAGKDICERDLAAGPFVINVDPAPEADVTTPEFSDKIACADAAGFAAGNATYSNGLEGTACEISGSIEATVVKNYTACGGTITITYAGKDICDRDLAAGPFVIEVSPAPEATVYAPQFPLDIECVDAAGFAAGNATYSNGLEETACDISGSIEATVVKAYDACGGTITITYAGKDICERDLAAGPFVIEVKPAPAPIFYPIEPANLACEDLATYVPEFLGYSNGIEGPCGINGSVQGVADPFTGSCGTFDVHFSYVSCGVEITSKQTITVIDETAPMLEGELPQGLSDVDACLANVPAAPTEEYIESLFSDNCGNVNATLTITSPEENTDCLWAVLYRYTIEDDCGNFAAPVKIYHNGGDTSAPELTGDLPTGVTGLQCLSENPGAPELAAIIAAYSDNCGDVIVTPFEPNISGTDCGWTATYEYEIKDTCGNKLPNIEIVNSGADTMAPELDGEIPLGENTVNACKDSDLGEPTEEEIAELFSDNCADITADNVTKVEKLAIGSDCEWIRVFEYIVRDDCGNAYPTFKVNYQGGDTEGPMATGECTAEVMTLNTSDWDGLACPEDASISLVYQQEITVDSEWTVGGIPASEIGSIYECYTDNCTAVEDLTFRVYELSEVKGPCSTTLTVTFEVEDSCLNKSADLLVCTFIINDTTAPVVTCPEGEDFGTVTETPTEFGDKATWIDNCQGSGDTATFTDVLTESVSGSGGSGNGVFTIECYDSNGGLFDHIDYVVTGTDGNGLPTYSGTLRDNGAGPYTLYYNDTTTRWEGYLLNSTTLIWYADTLSCDINDWTSTGGATTCVAIGVDCSDFNSNAVDYTLVRTFTADDGCGNVGSCEVTYTWSIGQACDDVAPVLDCPEGTFFGEVFVAPTAFVTSAPYSDEGNAGGTTTDYSDDLQDEQFFGESTNISIGCITGGQVFAVVDFVRTGFDAAGYAVYAVGSSTELPNHGYTLEYDAANARWSTKEYPNDTSASGSGIEVFYSPSVGNAPDCDPSTWTIDASVCDSIWVDCGFVGLDYTEYTLTRTFTATDDCDNVDTCDVVYSWIINNQPITRSADYNVVPNSDIKALALGASEESKVDFKAFPVPFDNEVTLTYEFDYRTDVTIEFFDTKGLLILSETNTRYVAGSTGRTTLDLSRTSSQVFYVKLTTSQGTITKKIVSSGK